MNKETALKRINPAFLKGICHRGLHNDRFSENGLKAFENAIKEKMPIELDVHITSDNKLVVFHDS
ncbi:MAG TPA: glycerophosphodiester phosphodiesterase, partial [Lachnospiraceae bacterium]|nr:glycerophosphodiester phosphodiesterase [Lachnospiraceae bacterium]